MDAAPPQTATFMVVEQFDLPAGELTSDGSILCASGSTSNEFFASGSQSDNAAHDRGGVVLHDLKTITCNDGSGTFTLQLQGRTGFNVGFEGTFGRWVRSYAISVADCDEGFSERDLTPPGIGERTPSQGVNAEAVVRTFLIADVRGYTRFTQEYGDEEAGRRAAAFAELARETVLSCGGELIELRGDEALCVFNSARQALRAAVELQTSFRRRTDDGPAFPLPIGIGLDAGEAVPIEGGYRGGALNTAARLCSLAAPGQILATDTVVSLARRLEGIRFVPRRPVRLKGLEQPVRVLEVVPEAGLPPLPVVDSKKRPRVTGGRLALAATTGAALVAAMIALILIRSSGPDAFAGLEPNAIGVIDAEAGGIASQLKLDSAPSAIAAGGKYVWAASKADGTVSRFDPDLRAVQTLTLGGSAGGIAYGAGSLWTTNAEERALVQINPSSGKEVQRITVGNGPGAVAVGKDAVWVANTIDGTLSRI
ncbi:MAG: hypothetical protein ACR2ML_03100, partial [Solirubrobacteraceae bacterium]